MELHNFHSLPFTASREPLHNSEDSVRWRGLLVAGRSGPLLYPVQGIELGALLVHAQPLKIPVWNF